MLEEKLKIKITKDGDKTRVFLTGVIDEDSVLGHIEKIQTPIILNFKGLTGLNSVGIRIFMKTLEVVSSRGLYFEECPAIVVRQMSMVPMFMGKAKVLSVYAPFVCVACEAEKMILLSQEKFANGKLDLPANLDCEYCKQGKMEFDGNPAKYFAFAAPKP